jgi:hypothetical protein
MKCYIVFNTIGGYETEEIDTNADIKFTDGGFVEYETLTEFVQDETKNIVRIYFE